MNVDWRTVGWLEYQMLLAGWNEIHRDKKDEPQGPSDFDRLKAIMATHSVH